MYMFLFAAFLSCVSDLIMFCSFQKVESFAALKCVDTACWHRQPYMQILMSVCVIVHTASHK